MQMHPLNSSKLKASPLKSSKLIHQIHSEKS